MLHNGAAADHALDGEFLAFSQAPEQCSDFVWSLEGASTVDQPTRVNCPHRVEETPICRSDSLDVSGYEVSYLKAIVCGFHRPALSMKFGSHMLELSHVFGGGRFATACCSSARLAETN